MSAASSPLLRQSTLLSACPHLHSPLSLALLLSITGWSTPVWVRTCVPLVAWGQLIFLQNLGTFNTVQQQDNVGLYAVAAILVGGANVQKATNKQAVIGVILFHTLFVVAPLAATKLVGDSAVSEYIRMFFSYGVIAVSLAMHAWKTAGKKAK